MSLITDHFRDKSIERFGFEMTEDEAEDYWRRGYPVRNAKLYRLSMRMYRRRTYRIVIVNHMPAIIARCTVTRQFKTIF